MTDQPEGTNMSQAAEAELESGIGDVLKGVTKSQADRISRRDKLDTAIARQREESDHRQILTRAQQRLEADELRHAEIVQEKAQSRSIIERTEVQIANLQAILTAEKANLVDLEVEDAAALTSINALRTKGIEL